MRTQPTDRSGRSLRNRIWLRLRALPEFLAELHDALVPGPFVDISRTIRPYTMCSTARLRGLYRAVVEVVSRGIPGDVVECGTARGGSAALLGLTLKRLGTRRRLWAFDTFEGLPPPTAADPDYEIAVQFTGAHRGELDEVAALFARLGIAESAQLIKGLFQDTLPTAGVGEIAVLHLDGDWYESVKTCLDRLYTRVSPGGIIQIDDYGHWAGARKAVDEFLKQRVGKVHLRYLDYSGRQLTKPPDKP